MIKEIGITAQVSVEGHVKIPAKIDTGADSSAIWATNIKFNSDDKIITFTLFGEGSPHYTGEVLTTTDYEIVKVRNSMGYEQLRFKTPLTLRIKGKKIRAWFNLADRSKNRFPILIGKQTLRGKFLVNPNINPFKKLTMTKNIVSEDDIKEITKKHKDN